MKIIKPEELAEEVRLETLKKISNLRPALTKACYIVENDAKLNCPVNTGDLRNSITHKVEDKQGIVYTNKSYAPYVEIGTGIWAGTGSYNNEFRGTGRQDRWVYQDAEGKWHSTIGQHPQPFMAPALVNNKKKIAEVFKEELD